MQSVRQSADRAAQDTRLGGPNRPRAPWLLVLACTCLAPAAGCAVWGAKKPPPDAAGPVDAVVLRAGGPEAEALPAAGTAAADLEAGKRLFQQEQYRKAESVLAGVAENKKNPTSLAEEAMYYQAECQRLQGRYPAAAETYNHLLNTFPMGRHAGLSRRRLFDIANYWLDETRAYMEACREKKEGKRWWVWPVSFVHVEKTKPLFDLEGHAIRMLEQVYITDPTGPLAEKALFYLGSVHFFREDYTEADHFFSELVKHHPNGEMAPKGLKFSIICKQMSTGGSEYDGRLVAEARELVDIAQRSYPELANQQQKFLMDQLYSITQQQADKDWKVAEFYRRVGKSASAYFMYDVVRRRYPGTSYEKRAAQRMDELRARVEREQAQEGTPPGAAIGAPPETGPVPRRFAPGAPLSGPETGPAPQMLPPSMTGGR